MERCPLVKRGMKRVAFPSESNERERERAREGRVEDSEKENGRKKKLSLDPDLSFLPFSLSRFRLLPLGV
jgi:hypothetical protein